LLLGFPLQKKVKKSSKKFTQADLFVPLFVYGLHVVAQIDKDSENEH